MLNIATYMHSLQGIWLAFISTSLDIYTGVYLHPGLPGPVPWLISLVPW